MTIDPRGVPTQTLYNEMDQPFATATGAWLGGANDFSLISGVDGVSKSLLYFDANGNVVTQKHYNDNPDTSGGTAGYVETHYHYDGIDQLVQTDAMLVAPGGTGVTWSKTFWVRDPMGRIIRQINADGTAISATYTEQGQVKSKRYHMQAYSLDASGEPNGALSPPASDPGDKVYSLTYADDNALETVTDSEGACAILHYDDFRRRVGRTDPAQTVLTRGLDLKGNVLWEQVDSAFGFLLKRSEYAYDEHQRLYQRKEQWVEDFLGDGWATTKYGYDRAGQLTCEIDDDGNSTEYVYDSAGRQRWKRHPSGLNAPGARDTEESVYDDNGNLLSLKLKEFKPDGSNVIYELAHVYDDLNRRIKTIQGQGTGAEAVTDTVYDSLGNVIENDPPRLGCAGRDEVQGGHPEAHRRVGGRIRRELRRADRQQCRRRWVRHDHEDL